MPRAELGSTKQLNNKLKSKGLQRLRWYCQVCERQMRDENGFKMHVQSESHTRKILIVGEDPKKYLEDYSNQFKRDFLQLLKTSHGEKRTHLNHFYQEYISNKEHVHMNATKWPSLTEFAKYLGREGICRVEEDEKGLFVSWIDNSPEALRRQDAVRRKERQDRGDEEREQASIREQIRRAKEDAEARGVDYDDTEGELKREEGEKIKLSFGAKSAATNVETPRNSVQGSEQKVDTIDSTVTSIEKSGDQAEKLTEGSAQAPAPKISMKMGFSSKQNVFATAKKNPLGGKKKASVIEQPKVISQAELIMKQEIEERERKRSRGAQGFQGPPQKKQRF
ncbi:putative C2H2 finger domain protein [Bisporella sp. PMI_857]|nr:putative C2H2 finger domain protein [Bisporella sp. PMI_857]